MSTVTRTLSAVGILFLVCTGFCFRANTQAADVEKTRPIEIDVDASEAPRRIIHSRLVIPASPGPLTLYYPKWIPGEHGPNGPIVDVAGLKLYAGGKSVSWQRAEDDMFAFHCSVPEGADAIEVKLDFLAPPSSASGFTSASSISAQLAVLNWNQFVLYPKGLAMGDIQCRASLRVPADWQLGTALPVAAREGPITRFVPVSLETLIDSTVLCGAHFREVPIGPKEEPAHFLEIAGDSAAAVELSPELKGHYDRLVAETAALFGARHYRSYRFLLAFSDHVAHFGEEHHESTDIRGPERGHIDASARKLFLGVCPHEFVHSWNGKYRRPADMVTRDYQEPERTRLLWVYEGLTQYLGIILMPRCGFWTPEQTRDWLALLVQAQQDQRGRSWRPLEDTAVAAQLLYGARRDWSAWRRGVDFYDEGVLLWLDVDTLIRQETKGERSLDDFCRRFHGGASGPPSVKPYTFDDIVADLNAVAPYDWKTLLLRRVATPADKAPLDGLHRAGWKLTYQGEPSDFYTTQEGANKGVDLASDIGLRLGSDGAVTDVVPRKAADKAGIAPGMKLVAVNGRRWSTQVLHAAVAATKTGSKPLELLLENEEYFKTYKLDYHEGAKYPRLERDQTQTDLLSEILKPRTPVGKQSSAARPARTVTEDNPEGIRRR